ncbi:50S ribosomal protein L3 [Xianfuyuplasma coldseepsis]|uniref:Large ribosomal subunit protein uL3 n=1 Tax=Candidatus Xianfuyuplasma coldseepsis TaxID=2782163 RepID=A0A7L7KRY3_9MOLU|nr:50S ribosomal protein L3 [Xianfuyuplasma coldseepsis]QMS85179.1 50S ribosomal protein L3 [Xianfuyuplasma coldseepsis]
MAKGILGTKVGMTQVFNEDGKLVPVTVVSCEPNVVLQKKTMENDGYESIQLGYKDKRVKLANKPELGHFAKSNSNPKRYLQEVRGPELYNFEVGQEITVKIFTEGEVVDVTGTSKGKGFAGSIKRHNQHRGPMGHGSHYHRGPGSMGPIDPNHVRPGKNLPGHMGHETVTIQNLEIVKVDVERNVLLIKGSVPGPKKGLVYVKHAVKSGAIEPLNPTDFITVEETQETEASAEAQE